MSRSLKKGPYIDPNVKKKLERAGGNKKKPIKTWARSCVVTPEMVGFTFLVHNGREFIPVKVEEAMVGHKLGEFSPTTKFVRHGGRMQRELEKKTGEPAKKKPQP